MPASKRFHPSHRGATPSIAEKMRARAKAVEATDAAEAAEAV